MKPLLQQWLGAIKARVGTLTMEVPLWLSRKRGKGGVWRAISKQQYRYRRVRLQKGAAARLRLA
jgi:hypothetical protein